MELPAATSSDVVTVPDGTPLTLKLEKQLSSVTAKVGDTVDYTIPYPVRINDLVVVPKGTPVSGTVVGVRHRGFGARDGEVKIAIGELSLPSGETVSLRQVSKPESNAKRVGSEAVTTSLMLANPVTAAALPLMLFSKGDEQVYRAGTWTTVYFNGPFSLSRVALANLQPPPYKGPPQIFFRNRKGYSIELFSGQDFVGELNDSVRLELKPGTYSFRTGKAKEQVVQLEVHEDHQYWVERERGGLFAKDPQQHRDEIEVLESVPRMWDRNFSLETPAYKGPAQVNFVSRDAAGNLFCGRKKLGQVGNLRMELKPGTYTFSTGKAKKQAVHVEVQEDHQYWIERNPQGVFIKDFQRLHGDFDDREHRSFPVLDIDFTLPSTRQDCVPGDLPRVPVGPITSNIQ